MFQGKRHREKLDKPLNPNNLMLVSGFFGGTWVESGRLPCIDENDPCAHIDAEEKQNVARYRKKANECWNVNKQYEFFKLWPWFC